MWVVLKYKLKEFENSLHKLMLNLAKQIVVDGEGAKKFVTVNINNARSVNMAKNIGFAIANSPLVKTAIAGEDPNWGRIIMAIGKSKENIIINKLTVKLGKFIVVKNGIQSENYNEKDVKEYMTSNLIEISIDLAQINNRVLLSPACSSYDQFNNFEERGNQFKKIVTEYTIL